MEKISFDKLEWQIPLPNARSKAVVHGEQQMRILELDQEFVDPHWCEKGHALYVLEGELELEFVDSRVKLSPGEAIFLDSGDAMKHKPWSLTKRVRLLLVEEPS